MRHTTTQREQYSPLGEGAHDLGVVTDEGGAGALHFNEVPHQLQVEGKWPGISRYPGSAKHAVPCPVASLWFLVGSTPRCSSHTSHPETSGKLQSATA